MRSTQKKWTCTRALIRGGIGSIEALFQAMQSAGNMTSVVNAKWASTVAAMSTAGAAHGLAAGAIGRAAEFREPPEPPEPEPTTRNTPNKPPPRSGGAEACKEIAMEDLERLGQMAAFEWARANALPGCDPTKFGEQVLRVYRACLSPASSIPRSASHASLQCSKQLPAGSTDSPFLPTATSSAGA